MNPHYVVTLAVLDSAIITPQTSILVGVRTEECNIVHPNVISVPTGRVPQTLGCAMEAQAALGSPVTPEATYAAQSIMCQKLGVADEIERGHLRVAAATLDFFDGHAPSPTKDDTSESLRMLNVAACVADLSIFPSHTPCYRHISAISVGVFLDNAYHGAKFALGELTFPMCGLCIESTAEWLRRAIAVDGKETK